MRGRGVKLPVAFLCLEAGVAGSLGPGEAHLAASSDVFLTIPFGPRSHVRAWFHLASAGLWTDTPTCRDNGGPLGGCTAVAQAGFADSGSDHAQDWLPHP